MVIGFEKEIQTECLVAFAHSRIIGLMARDCEKDNLSSVFCDIHVEKKAKAKAKEIEEYIQDLATRDTINHKIANSPSKYIATCYHNYYMKLTNLFNKTISNKESVIEVLIGIHLLILATEKGYIGNENGEDDIEYYKGLLVFFKEEIYLSELTKKTVDRMEEVTRIIFDLYWLKDKNQTVSKRNKKRK